MIHEIDPTVKIWLGYGRDKEPTEKAFLFDKETTRNPLPSVLILSLSARDGRFASGGASNQEPDGDTRRRDNDLDRLGPSDRRNTLRPMSLVYCTEM